ncbi:unnamed protein product [Toxocara canis]|uniref:Uncharacterized protein n=1 Tax=Toxocara canis TaxID=6265 RepID=A0A183U714_TOXCA|nr:unnamed protein product [Toxocara canis]
MEECRVLMPDIHHLAMYEKEKMKMVAVYFLAVFAISSESTTCLAPGRNLSPMRGSNPRQPD